MRLLLALALAVSLFLSGSIARAFTVDEIIQKNIDARGGAAKLRAIVTLRSTGKVRAGNDDFTLSGVAVSASKRPTAGGSFRTRNEFTLQGLTQVQTYDGAEAWSVDPFEGRRDPFHVPAEESKDLADGADFDGALVDWQAKGHKVELLGTEDVDGTPAYKLRIALKDGDVVYSFIDTDAFLEVRTVKHSKVRGVERVNETNLGGYAEVSGVWMPMSIESHAKGSNWSAQVTIERVEVNVPVDDAMFPFPPAGTSVGRALLPSAPAAATNSTPPPRGATTRPTIDKGVLSGLGARNIGSAAMSGRIAAIAGRSEHGTTTLFVGAASGGVWKSEDDGTIFKPVFDKNPVQSIGAIAIDPTDPKTVWVGTGESWTRNSVSVGDGIYKSTDGGETWTNMGLAESERITKIVVSPSSKDTVYACVPGKLWSDSDARGLYKTTDGGKHWTKILRGSNLSTGCSGLTMDPKDPEVLFAGLWDFRRKGWTFRSGGDGPDAASGSGLYRSADGGKTWTELTAPKNHGLPPGPWGRVEVVVAPSDPKIVYTFIESKASALYRSSDGGQTWEERDKSQRMVWRPFYFAKLIVDPKNPDRLFKPDLELIVSEDGGKSFASTGGGSHGDWHDVWIDPHNPKHVVGGDDGGLWLSHDGGSHWWKGQNLPISQFYHVSVDARDPYQVYGGLQDNDSWVGQSSHPGGISNAQWEPLYGGDGFWTIVDPTDPDAVYAEAQGGTIARINRKTHTARDIQPTPAYKEKLRFNWNTPIYASPTQKGTIYIGAQFLFRSRDRGDNWERISPDLTTNDPEKQKQEQSGGVTVDNSSAEMHTTIYSISESPKDPQVIWVGTDDGNLQRTRDGGKTWTNVQNNIRGLPRSWVSWVEASQYDAGTAYVTLDRHTFGDMTPHVFKTTDFGQTWTRIVAPNHGVRGYAHVIKEDPVRKELLFLGTEVGLFISVDGGGSWAEFKGGDFPSVAVRDLQVHTREHDLVLATHGRGIWVVDDIQPLRALAADVLGSPAAFLSGRPVQQRMPARQWEPRGDAAFVGQNPPGGAIITYYLRSRHLFGPIKLEVLDASGKVIDTLDATKRRGINRVQWNMQIAPAAGSSRGADRLQCVAGPAGGAG